MKTKQLTILFLGLYTQICFSQTTVLSLNDAIQFTLVKNYDIQIDQLSLENAEQNNTWGNAGRYPDIQLQLGGSNQYQYNNPASPFALGGFTNNAVFNSGISGQWILFNGFNVSLKKDQLSSQVKQSEWELLATMENQVEALIQAYYLAQFEKEKLKTIQEILQSSKEKWKLSKLQNKLGAGSKFEMIRDETNFYTDSTRYIDQKVQWKTAIQDLNYYMNNDNIHTTYDLKDKLNVPSPMLNFEDLLDEMLKNNSNIKRQLVISQLRENQIQQQRNTKVPTLTADISFTSNTNRFTADMPQVDGGFQKETNIGYNYGPSAGVTLRVPIFSGGKNNRLIQTAIIQKEVADTESKKTLLFLKNKFTKLFMEYHNSIEKVKLSTKSLEAAKLNLNLSRQQMDSGMISSFEFRQIQNSYLESSIRLLNNQYFLIINRVALLKISGKLVKL
ncbi:TolC family protein [Flammeovirga pacifica]|uniref:Transporter n=1 Tax=Flammeovirga pacifica TaxID=915059 RepID=A0A1S1Z1H3_FLAPC|nr:TolC family protein [Flammeovirga pacifica]OHX67124.1 hypothetical protein NH26_12610 [Flammeovirga pacifica]